MYIVTRVFDDDRVELTDISTMTRSTYTLSQLEKQCPENVKGVISYNNKIISVVRMKILSFPTESEAEDYAKEYRGKILYIHDTWWMLYEDNKVEHVDYYVYTQVGEEIAYVAEKGYTPYIQGAKKFDEVEAIKQARSMTKYSKTGKFWKTRRVISGSTS